MSAKEAQAGRVRYGTSSWSEKTWVGPFYPLGTKPADFLSRYATRFDCVEADVTYYRVPSRAMVRGWDRKTPEGFTLCAKFPRSVVHCGEGPRPDGARLLAWEHVGGVVEEFLGVMRLLGDKLGPLVVQLPYLNKQAFAGPEPFLERLDDFLGRLPAGPRYAVEVRNKAWIGAPLLELLRARGAALVLVDILYMPHPADLARELDLVTADFAYARLIGDRKKVEELADGFGALVLDATPRLERWAALLRELAPRVRETFAFANNHYAGHGPATIEELAALVGGEGPGPPPGAAATDELPF